MENDDWADRIVVELHGYDAGTDAGKSFTSADRPLSPREPIEAIDEAPLAFGGNSEPLGTFTFRQIS